MADSKKKEIVMIMPPSLHQEIKEVAKNYGIPMAAWCKAKLKDAINAERSRK